MIHRNCCYYDVNKIHGRKSRADAHTYKLQTSLRSDYLHAHFVQHLVLALEPANTSQNVILYSLKYHTIINGYHFLHF